MKKLIITILFLLIGLSQINLIAQVMDIKVGGIEYRYDSLSQRMFRSDNKLLDVIANTKGCESYVASNSSLNDLFTSVFSIERLQFLAEYNETLVITIICDSTGHILETYFKFINAKSEITHNEIKLLDDAFKKKGIDLYTSCTNIPYYQFFLAFNPKRCLRSKK